MDIAREAKAQTVRGVPVLQVRRSIDAMFSQYGRGTDTPMPSNAGSEATS